MLLALGDQNRSSIGERYGVFLKPFFQTAVRMAVEVEWGSKIFPFPLHAFNNSHCKQSMWMETSSKDSLSQSCWDECSHSKIPAVTGLNEVVRQMIKPLELSKLVLSSQVLFSLNSVFEWKKNKEKHTNHQMVEWGRWVIKWDLD